MMLLRDLLIGLDACDEAILWAGQRRVSRASWIASERGDWLLWLVATLGVDQRLVVLAACDCAREALSQVPAGDDLPRLAIEAAEAWTRGEVSGAVVREAATVCYAAEYTSYAGTCDAACAAAARTAYAYASEHDYDYGYNGAYAAACAASTVANADGAVAYGAARGGSLRCGAHIVRDRIPWDLVADAIEVLPREPIRARLARHHALRVEGA